MVPAQDFQPEYQKALALGQIPLQELSPVEPQEFKAKWLQPEEDWIKHLKLSWTKKAVITVHAPASSHEIM